jgi:MFS transporter, DHA2 family, methylenomycin A resistance protein
VQLDVSIVNVALATIGKDLRTGFSDLQWIVDAYTIAFASFLLSAGALADRIGARRTFVIGFILFVCSSIGCAFASSATILIASRAVQGIGAALLVPCSLALLNHATADDSSARARAIGLWTAAGSVALAAGPIVGGVLVSSLGWRSIFFVNVPLGALGIWLAFRSLQETPQSDGAFDLLGQLSAVGALGTLTAAVITAGTLGWSAPLVLMLFALAIICGAVFLAVESHQAHPMLPLDLFRRKPFTAASLIGLILNFTLYGAIFVLALYMQRLHGYSPLLTGFALLPFCVALGTANVLARRLTTLRGPRIPMVVSLAIGALGYLALALLGVHTPYPVMLIGLLILPLGVGLAVPLMTTALLADIEKERSGIGSGVLNTVRQAGGALGVALLGSLLSAHGIVGMKVGFVVSAVLMLAIITIALWGLPLKAPRTPSLADRPSAERVPAR